MTLDFKTLRTWPWSSGDLELYKKAQILVKNIGLELHGNLFLISNALYDLLVTLHGGF